MRSTLTIVLADWRFSAQWSMGRKWEFAEQWGESLQLRHIATIVTLTRLSLGRNHGRTVEAGSP
jgi:hypothetical protein